MSELLVTGGAGFIGSHMCVELLQAGHQVVVVDNLSNSSLAVIEAVQRITQRELTFYEVDLRDGDELGRIFSTHGFDAVLHFAGLKAVGESVAKPALYYDNNVIGSIRLIEAMTKANVKSFVFSSSATVYGIPDDPPIDETFPTAPINPYGRTKLHIEEMLRDLAQSDEEWRISLLRYFNPIGAHPSGEIGEDPRDIPNNLVPFITQVLVGRRAQVNVFGNDYPTPDGTGIRDYIHVVDLVRGHLAALDFLADHPGAHVHNLGTGQGYSVMEMIQAFEAATGRCVPYEVVDRRSGDAAISYTDPTKARDELEWQAELDLARMCNDAWRWQSSHPNGYP